MNLHIYVHYKQCRKLDISLPDWQCVHKYIQEIDLVRYCLLLFADRTCIIPYSACIYFICLHVYHMWRGEENMLGQPFKTNSAMDLFQWHQWVILHVMHDHGPHHDLTFRNSTKINHILFRLMFPRTCKKVNALSASWSTCRSHASSLWYPQECPSSVSQVQAPKIPLKHACCN